MDYEVAISHIESLREDFEKDVVDTRPYTGYEYDNNLETEALGVAYDALKKQIPMKPNHKIEHFKYHGIEAQNHIYYCPKCDTEIETEGDWCPNCGQALDWRDD